MEVKMNQEIRDYQESMFFGLNFRQCFFSVLAILAAVAIFLGQRAFQSRRSEAGCACLGLRLLQHVAFLNTIA